MKFDEISRRCRVSSILQYIKVLSNLIERFDACYESKILVWNLLVW